MVNGGAWPPPTSIAACRGIAILGTHGEKCLDVLEQFGLRHLGVFFSRLVLALDACPVVLAEVVLDGIFALGVLVGLQVGSPLRLDLAIRSDGANRLFHMANRTNHAVI